LNADTAIRGVGFGREIRPQGVSIASEFTIELPVRPPANRGFAAELAAQPVVTTYEYST
jgi:hypothetical protein